MSYTIRTPDDAYETIEAYVREHLSDEVRIASPRRRFISVEDMTAQAKKDLEDLGAAVEETFQFSVDATARQR